MWSEGFAAEERAFGSSGITMQVAAVACAALAAVAVAVEVLFSLYMTGREMTNRGGSWTMALLSLGLGFAGPYAAIQISRGRSLRDEEERFRRIGYVGLVTLTVAGIALAWLLLIHSVVHLRPAAL